jgi:hypothetical protein
MSKVKEIIQNSDLNDLNVGDKLDLSTADVFSIYALSKFDERDEMSIYENCKDAIGEVTYISKDYLIIDDYYIMLSFHSV